jgi:hypothetical protein
MAHHLMSIKIRIYVHFIIVNLKLIILQVHVFHYKKNEIKLFNVI